LGNALEKPTWKIEEFVRFCRLDLRK
jgi:hypothetical protein